METSDAEKSIQDVNFGIGFNDVQFSDRVLRLQIEPSQQTVTDLKVETLNLFMNGMKESQKNVEFTLRIYASENAAFMDMLNFVYDKPLVASSRDELMAVMMVADKFEVTSCTRQCVKLLLKSPMTIESALFYLEFPSEVFVSEVTRPIIDAAKNRLCSHFNNFTKSKQKEAMSLHLCGIEVVVGSADFDMKPEENFLDFMLKWARKNYLDLEERRDILTNRLLGLICLSCLSYSKLIEMVDCQDFDSTQVSKLVFNSLCHKIEAPEGPNSIATFRRIYRTKFGNDGLSNCSFERCSRSNHSHVVFFDIRKEDCAALATNSRIYSEAFDLSGRRFSLLAQRCKEKGSSTESLGLFVEMGSSGSCTLKYELSAMKKPSYEFERLLPLTASTFTDSGRSWGTLNLFKMPWTQLMGDDDNDYIIDNVIHIRAQIIHTLLKKRLNIDDFLSTFRQRVEVLKYPVGIFLLLSWTLFI